MIICNPNSRDWARVDAENFKPSRNVKLKRQRHILCRTLENLIHEVILKTETSTLILTKHHQEKW